MASVDDLFRKPNAPLKRKLEDPTSSFLQQQKQQSHKAAKLNNGDSPHASTTNGSKTAFSEDGNLDAEDDDIEAGPALPPENAEDEPDEDDEGRFFGGGVSKQERQVLDYIEENEAAEVEEKIDSAWLRKVAIGFERKINKNAELRAKYEDEPMKFVGSEADLDAEVKGLSVLSGHSDLYQEFAKLGCVGSLVGLLAHENTDIAIAVCELLAELTDEDAGADEEQWKVLVRAMIEADVIELLVSNLGRLDEGNENDVTGVYHVLSVMENLLSDPSNTDGIGKNKKLLDWLGKRITLPDLDARAQVGQNRQYAGEILAILLQGSEKSRKMFTKQDGVETLLQLLSVYRKKDPEKDSDEEEFVENLFDCLVSVVKETAGADKFLEGEGVELCLIMLREGKFSKIRALKILDHAAGAKQGSVVGERIVEAAGLKTIFGIFMKSKTQEREAIEHVIGIFASLLRFLPAESSARIRLLAKFVEKNYEKIGRLVDMRGEYATRVGQVDDKIKQEKEGVSSEDVVALEPEWLSRKFDAGLFSLQTVEIILAWLIAEDDGAGKMITGLLSATNAGTDTLRSSLQEQLAAVDPEEGKDMREMLEALIRCL